VNRNSGEAFGILVLKYLGMTSLLIVYCLFQGNPPLVAILSQINPVFQRIPLRTILLYCNYPCLGFANDFFFQTFQPTHVTASLLSFQHIAIILSV
jgi:hypothetical protein